jgi:hypothetical protein
MSQRPIGLAPGAELGAAGQDARKYASTNPVVRWLIARWLTRLKDAVEAVDVMADVGTGEGIALGRLEVDASITIGVDFRHDKLRLAQRRMPSLRVLRADAGMLPLRNDAVDLVTCIEVLEHLVTFEPAVAELARVTRGRCVLSVPWEPFFRSGNLLRGKNIGRLGNDPEHVQGFSPRRLRQVLNRHFAEVRVRRCFPWIVAIAEMPITGGR